MNTNASAAPMAEPPFTPGHKRSKTAILKAIVSPHKAHKKSASTSHTVDTDSNPLNSYMFNANGVPQLPPLDTSASLLPPLDLEPPSAPFVLEERRKRLHKKSFSSISISSLISKKDESATVPTSPARGSFDISGTLRDLVSPNRGNADAPSTPSKSIHSKKPKKSKSALDLKLLRRKDKKEPNSPTKDNKENQRPQQPTTPLLPPSSRRPYSVEVTVPPLGTEPEGLFALPVAYSSKSRPKVTTSGSDPSVPSLAQSGSSTSSKGSARKQEIEELVRKYTPTEYSAGSRQGYFGSREPVPIKPSETESRNSSHRSKEKKPRPKSSFLPSPSVHSGGFSVASPRKSHEIRRSEDKRPPDPPVKEEKNSPASSQSSGRSGKTAGLDLAGIDTAFEALLDSRGVPPGMRIKMRALDVRVKQEFIHKERQMEKPKDVPAPPSVVSGLGIFGRRPKTAGDARPKSKGKDSTANDPSGSPTKRSRPRSRTFGSSKEDKAASSQTAPNSPTKKQKNGEDRQIIGKILFPPGSNSSLPPNGPPSPTMVASLTPEEWVGWLKEAGKRRNFGVGLFAEEIGGSMPEYERHMKDVEVAVLHKLRLVLRNETLRWVEAFTKFNGMEAIWAMVERVLGVEWREEHEDNILHELLLCLKGLCTASLALQRLAEMASKIFPRLLDSLFDEEKKGPSEFTTRGIIISLLYVHLQTSPVSQRPLRTRRILSYLADKKPDPKKRPLDFIEVAHVNRPYRRWCKELVNVTKEVFWIFLHGSNVIQVLPPVSTSLSYAERNFPQDRPPVPAAAHVGGVEWEATSYLAAHMDLLNGCIASLATREERNDLRLDLKNSGWERAMGGALRTCKEKLHSAVHEGLKTWVRAASEDEWYVGDVRFGPRVGTAVEHGRSVSPVKPAWKRKEEPAPKLDVGLGLDFGNKTSGRNGESVGLVGAWEY